MNPAFMHNIGALLTAAACDLVSLSTSNDGSEIDGAYVDRSGHLSAKLVIAFEAALTEDETLTVAANLQDDADGAGAGTDYGDALASAVVATGGSGGTTERGVAVLDVDLAGAKQFIRPQYTLSLSAGSSDTVLGAAVLILGPKQETPNA
ncbi:hypothetical protein [Gaopeijia maritima]|uniref:hypothetical protein n=1 Tax=Gaopeijia maritima TaxID=3119007 RepID=UPI003287B71E